MDMRRVVYRWSGADGASSSAKRVIQRALSDVVQAFPGVVSDVRPLSFAAAAEFGADWIVDVFFVPSAHLMRFEDWVDTLTANLHDTHGLHVMILGHTREATEAYYLEGLPGRGSLEEGCQELGLALSVTTRFVKREEGPSWSSQGLPSVAYECLDFAASPDDCAPRRAA